LRRDAPFFYDNGMDGREFLPHPQPQVAKSLRQGDLANIARLATRRKAGRSSRGNLYDIQCQLPLLLVVLCPKQVFQTIGPLRMREQEYRLGPEQRTQSSVSRRWGSNDESFDTEVRNCRGA
jgi:hypothetical protein